MSRIDRWEREERIRHDDGDPDDTVLLLPKTAQTYHDDRDCRYVRDADGRGREVSRETAQEATRRAPCRSCVLEDTTTVPGDERFSVSLPSNDD